LTFNTDYDIIKIENSQLKTYKMAAPTPRPHWVNRILTSIFATPVTVLVTFAGIVTIFSLFNGDFARKFFLWFILWGGTFAWVITGGTYLVHYLISRQRANAGQPPLAETSVEWITLVWRRIFHNSLTTTIFLIILVGLMGKCDPQIAIEAGKSFANLVNHLLVPIIFAVLVIGLMLYGFRVMLGMSKLPGQNHGKKHSH